MRNNIRIDLSRDKLRATIRITGDDWPSKADIYKALEASKVTHGILEDVVELCAMTRPKDVKLIAKGDPPVPGKDGWVEIMWKKQDTQQTEVEDGSTVDFRETSKIVSVNEGALLAQVFPPEKGEPGKAVTGQPVLPPKAKEFRIVAGRGVKLDSTGTKAYSTIQGMPVAKKISGALILVVEPSYTQVGDVNMKTGNIRFKGDVTVTGNITETMTVEASGNIKVNGIITGASVFCGESVIVQKNIIASEVTAGIGAVECGKLKYLIQDIYADLTELVKVMEKLREQSPNLEKIPFAQVINSLIENRYKNIRVNTKQLVATAKTFNLPYQVEEAVGAVGKFTTGLYTPQDFKDMMFYLSQSVEIMNNSEAKNSRVVASAVSASTINCSGEVVVTSKGCVNTTIYAGGNVKITGQFKGGEIYSEGNVEIDELGSNLGASPLVRVKMKNRVKIGKAVPGSIIQVGSNRINITKELGTAIYKLNSEGDIEII